MKAPINIPDNLNEITLWDYQQFLKIEDPTPVDVLKTFLGLTDNIVKRMPKVQVDSISNHILKMFEEKPELTTTFTYKGRRYGFIPELDKLSWDENSVVSDNLSEWDKVHVAMRVLYRPITTKRKGKYIIEDFDPDEHEKNINEMDLMPYGIALGAMLFFYHLANDLLSYIPNYLAKEVESQMASCKNGQDTTNSLQSQEGLMLVLKKLQSLQYTNAISISHMNPTKLKRK